MSGELARKAAAFLIRSFAFPLQLRSASRTCRAGICPNHSRFGKHRNHGAAWVLVWANVAACLT